MARAFMTIGTIRNGAVTVRARGFIGAATQSPSHGRPLAQDATDAEMGRPTAPHRHMRREE